MSTSVPATTKLTVPLSATHSAAATVFLLLLHLLQNGIFLDFEKIATLVFSESQPKFFDPLALLDRASAPYFIICCFVLCRRG
jgi:hypothetical protein